MMKEFHGEAKGKLDKWISGTQIFKNSPRRDWTYGRPPNQPTFQDLSGSLVTLLIFLGYCFVLGGRCFLPQAARSYPIPMAHRVTPVQPEVTPGAKSYWHIGTTPSLVWQTKYKNVSVPLRTTYLILSPFVIKPCWKWATAIGTHTHWQQNSCLPSKWEK